MAVFIPVRFEMVPMVGVVGLAVDALSVIGVGVVIGLMAFGFFGLRPALWIGSIAALGSAPFVIGFLHDYHVLSGSLVAYAVSTVVCYLMSFRNRNSFDFALLSQRTGNFDSAQGQTESPSTN
jgi:hypothetical protein